IVKERRSFWLLREWHSTQPPSRVKPYLQRLFEVIDQAVCVAAAVSMGRIIERLITLARGRMQ
ncbi:MAG: hypothetical protein SFX46_16720, partial [Aeromonas hydrophila]|nr:hypothetical protein [Aeromonas hydrophila]